jgi:deoxyribonuclease V
VWPTDADSLIACQEALAGAAAEPWTPPARSARIGGCWVCFARGLAGPGSAGDPAWAAAVVMRDRAVLEVEVTAGAAGSAYVPGMLALRLGPLMEQATRALHERPDVLLVDATGRDHPRGAGLALHLGAELDLPTIGVTHRPLVGTGAWPEDRRGATSPLRVADRVVGCWLRTRPGVRPLVVHPGWRVDLDTAVRIVTGTTGQRRTPEPLRRARQAARRARSVR